ncbi:MAG TPA: hypothetical protein VF296_03850 [Gallionella sp.]
MMRNYFALVLFALITGCASSGPQDSRFSVGGRADVGQTGIIFGKICEGNGLWFKEESSIKEILHIGGSSEFALRLPPGKYVLTSIASPAGKNFTSPAPFSFEVRANEVVYVGTLLPSWANVASEAAERCGKELNSIVGKKMYGQKQPDSPVLIANDKDEAVKAVKERYPNVDLSNAIVRLMH